MIKMPKRRRLRDNPYFLSVDDNDMKYVSFKNINNKIERVPIDDELFFLFNKFELDDLSEMNEFDNHIEHSELLENSLYARAKNKPNSVEELAIRNIIFEKVMRSLELLPSIQSRRLKKYYLYDMTLEEIAKEEGCTKMAVKFSIDVAIKNIRKYINKIY